jgi:alkylation response protein AidB-like acyl-CoA dehydrogenase
MDMPEYHWSPEQRMDFTLSDEQRALVEMASGLAGRHSPDPHVSWEEAGSFPWDFCRELANQGLTGIDIPAERGGQGLTLLDSVLVLEAVGSTAPHLADAVQVTNFGAVRQIAAFANQRVIREVLGEILAGRAMATIAMSEPGAGSAVTSLTTRAEREGDLVRVTGQKVFNSNGPHATHYVVWARFGEGRDQVGAVVFPAGSPGFERGKTERFLSGEAHCSLHFNGATAPADYVLLDRDGVRRMFSIFNIERLGNSTRSLAFGELALRLATTHLLERRTGGQRLADLQGLQWKLADARLQLDSARLLLYRAASMLVDGTPDPLYTSMAKVACNEAGFNVTNQALQLFGGYGFSTEYPLDYLLMRTRGWMIAGGSVEVQRNRIAREILKRHRPD